jgi:hypothetical protein
LVEETVIQLEDLRAPVLTADQRRLLDDAEREPVVLTEGAVIDAAVTRAGLTDFGPEDFRERLRAILGEVDADQNATAFVRRTFHLRSVAHAVNRLRLIDLLDRHPEIADEKIERPLIIAGLPRSGTTHLVNLLCADERLRSLPYWLALEPLAGPGEDRRVERATAAWRAAQLANPTMSAFHPMPADHIHEDIELQMPDFSSYVWEWWSRLPEWRDSYLARDQLPSYEYGRTVLQALQWQAGDRRRWVLKAPQHFEQLSAVMRCYPDATVVFTHRDPVAALQSIVTQISYRARMREKVVDPDWHFAYWSDRLERLLGAYLRDLEWVPAAQRFDVDFDEFMRDDVAMVVRILERAGLELSPEAREAFDRFMVHNPRGKHGRIDHDLRRDFGVDPDELWGRFSDYAATRRLAREVT